MKLNRCILFLYNYTKNYSKQEKYVDKLYNVYMDTSKKFKKRALENKGRLKIKFMYISELYEKEAKEIKKFLWSKKL